MPGRLSQRAVADRLQAGEAAPIGRRLGFALGGPEHAAMELRQRAAEAERLADLLLQAGRAVVVRAAADQHAARLEQRPGTRDVGEVLFLVLGQQHEAERPGAALDPRLRALELQEIRPEGLLAIDLRERRILGAQEERPPFGERSGFEGVGEARLAWLTRFSPRSAQSCSSLRARRGGGAA